MPWFPGAIVANLYGRLSRYTKRNIAGTLYVSHQNITYTDSDAFIEITWHRCANCKSNDNRSVAREINGYLDWRVCDDCGYMWDPNGFPKEEH